MAQPHVLAFNCTLPLKAANAGLFISRGHGLHPTRIIDSYELIFVRRGMLSLAEEKRAFEVKAGQTLLLWPGREHRGTRDYPPDLSFYWLHFYLQPGQRKRGAPLLAIPQLTALPEGDRLAALLHRFLDDQESGRLEPLSASLLVMLMLAEVAAAKQPATPATSTATALAARVDTFINTRFYQPISTSDIAREFDCNPDYLGRVFRKIKGRTIGEAIQRRRLNQARRLLVESALNVKQVAQECGFDEAGYFRRLFRRQAGMSPLAFRRLYARIHTNTA